MELYTTQQLAKIVKLSIHTIYKKKKDMKEDIHFFQYGTGKIRFSDKAINFLLTQKKGINKNEGIQRNSFQKRKQPLSLSEYIS